MPFIKATKTQAKLRFAIAGPSKSGKTFTALTIGCALGGRIAVIDTERGSASKYANLFNFDVLELNSYSPSAYVAAIKEAEAANYEVIIVDSLTQAWSGKGGALELVDIAAKRSQSQNTYFAWRDVTPLHNALVDAMIGSKAHLIATIRSKTEYVLETNNKGQQVPKRVGMAPVQRADLEYEFDIFAEMDREHSLIVQGSRCPALSDVIIPKPDGGIAVVIKAWLEGAEPPPVKAAAVSSGRYTGEGDGPIFKPTEQAQPVVPPIHVITDKQRYDLYALVKTANINYARMKVWLKEKYGVESAKYIPLAHYAAICKAITSGKVTAPVVRNPVELPFDYGPVIEQAGLTHDEFDAFVLSVYQVPPMLLTDEQKEEVIAQVNSGYAMQWCLDNVTKQEGQGEQA